MKRVTVTACILILLLVSSTMGQAASQPNSTAVVLNDFLTRGLSTMMLDPSVYDKFDAIVAEFGAPPSFGYHGKNKDELNKWARMVTESTKAETENVIKELIEQYPMASEFPVKYDIQGICLLYWAYYDVKKLRQLEQDGYRIVAVVGQLNGDKVVYLSRG